MAAIETDNTVVAKQLIDALCRTRRFPHPVTDIRMIETHISWVLLTGEFAYKIKKPVALGFLDFSRLDQRHAACLEELRLNRRLAPEFYVAVVPITGTPVEPSVAGVGTPIEYAVQMRKFAQASLLNRQLAAGLLGPADMAQLGERIADFHAGLPPAEPGAGWGSAAAIRAPFMQSLAQVEAIGLPPGSQTLLAKARAALLRQLAALVPVFSRRLAEGRIRECHGDLHLGNLVRTDSGLTAFDALEFDPALRWIDVASEVAFPAMDLLVRGRADLAFTFLNAYLSRSGDYGALRVLACYLGYRALVRAKVALLAPSAASAARPIQEPSVDDLLKFAERPLGDCAPLLALTCGVSGSGKTWVARQLASLLPAIHTRSDVERKRLAGLAGTARSGSPPAGGIYTAAASIATYARLHDAADAALAGGFSVILDATYLNRPARAPLVTLAHAHSCAAAIIYCRGDMATLTGRVIDRGYAGRDASEADVEILRRQLASIEPPVPAEADAVIEVDAGERLEPATIRDQLRAAVGDTMIEPQPSLAGGVLPFAVPLVAATSLESSMPAKYPEFRMPDGPYAGDVTAREAWDRLTSDPRAVLVDVRTQVEWNLIGKPDLSSVGREPLYLQWMTAKGPNPGFPGELKAALDARGAATDTPLFFLCQSGGRSKISAIQCTALGYTACYNIAEGFEGALDGHKHRNSVNGWKVAGLPWTQS